MDQGWWEFYQRLQQNRWKEYIQRFTFSLSTVLLQLATTHLSGILDLLTEHRFGTKFLLGVKNIVSQLDVTGHSIVMMVMMITMMIMKNECDSKHQETDQSWSESGDSASSVLTKSD